VTRAACAKRFNRSSGSTRCGWASGLGDGRAAHARGDADWGREVLVLSASGLALPGMTVVVSPLVALMRDQHQKPLQLGRAAAQVNSAIPADEARDAKVQIDADVAEFMFTTPEQITTDDM
jgi:hypothetical protein